MKMKSILMVFSLTASLQLNGQATETTLPVVATRFFSSSLAVGPATFRDFATSPLFYNGSALSGQIAWTKVKDRYERKWSMRSSIASAKPLLPELENPAQKASALFSTSDIAYQQLRPWSRFNKGKWSYYLGGVGISTLNFRTNQALGNSSVGIEAFFNAMASGKVNYDLSHEKTGTRKFLWMKREVKPTTRALSLQFNIGLLNANYRQAYDYKGFPEVNGSKLNPFNLVLNSSGWAFNGTRFSSELEFRRYQAGGNAVSWSYVWDALSATGREHLFQMSAHRIQLTLHFNRKK
jgi:hypothetical protein